MRGRNGLAMVEYVDGVVKSFQKPGYLREYHGIYLKNGRVKDAVKAMKVTWVLVHNKRLCST
jgi:hypothetical protein